MHSEEKIIELINESKIEKALKCLEENLREKIAKEKGVKSELSVVKKMLAETKGNPLDVYNCVHPFIWEYEKLYAVITPTLIVGSRFDFGLPESTKDVNIIKMLTDYTNTDMLAQVDMEELKVNAKLKKNSVFCLDGYYIACDSKILLNMLTFTGTDYIAVVRGRGESHKSLVYSYNVVQNKIGAMCPMKFIESMKEGVNND